MQGKNIKSLLRGALCLTAAIVLATTAQTTTADAATKECTIVFQGAVQGEIKDCGCKKRPLGGLAGRSALIDTIREENPNLVLLDGGNTYAEPREERRIQTEFLLEQTGKLGYEVFGVGPWDFNYGVDFIREHDAKHGFVHVNCNLMRDGELLFEPYRVIEQGGVRVGVISVFDDKLKMASMQNDLEGIEILNPIMALESYLPELKEKCDVVVLLSNLNKQTIPSVLEGLGAGNVIDLVIDGYNGQKLLKPQQVGDTAVVSANNKGKYMGQVDLIVEDGEVTDLQYQLHYLDISAPQNKTIEKAVNEFLEANPHVSTS